MAGVGDADTPGAIETIPPDGFVADPPEAYR
jgi:hypothetical protein